MNIADLILPNFESDSESDGTDAITSILTKVEGLCSKLHDSRHHTSILFSSQEGTLVRARQEGVDDGTLLPSVHSIINNCLVYQRRESSQYLQIQNQSEPIFMNHTCQTCDGIIVKDTFELKYFDARDHDGLHPVNQLRSVEGATINIGRHQGQVIGNPSSSNSSFYKRRRSASCTDFEGGTLMRISSSNGPRTVTDEDGLFTTRQRSPIRVDTYTPYDLLKTALFETYHGFIEDPLDAVYVVQGTLEGVLPAFRGNSDDMACIKVRSGTVIVMPETGLTVRRWRDGLKWSPSRAYGNFLLYRQIESKNSDVSTKEDDRDLSPYSTPYGSTTGLQPTFTSKTLKEGTQLTENGLTKRTITVKGSDGEKYRVVSYYNSRDVMDMMRQMQQHHVNFDIASGFIRASDDVRLKEMMKRSGIDAVALVRQSYPLWKPEEFLLTTNLSPHQQAELNNSQNHKRRRRREYVSEPRLKLETALEEHGSG